MECGSDHNALVAEICLKLKESKKLIPRTKLNTEALDQYKLEVNKAIEEMKLEDNKTDNVEELRRKFKSAVLLSLKKTPRIDRPKKHGSYIILEQHKTNQEPKFLFLKWQPYNEVLNPDTYL